MLTSRTVALMEDSSARAVEKKNALSRAGVRKRTKYERSLEVMSLSLLEKSPMPCEAGLSFAVLHRQECLCHLGLCHLNPIIPSRFFPRSPARLLRLWRAGGSSRRGRLRSQGGSLRSSTGGSSRAPSA